MSEHNYVDAKGKKHQSCLVLSINNWRFNRNLNNLKAVKVPACQLENWVVEIKLSSTAFSGGNSVKAVKANNGYLLYFDTNGLHMGYDSFMGLIKKPEFLKFLEKVRQTYEKQSELEKTAGAESSEDSDTAYDETETNENSDNNEESGGGGDNDNDDDVSTESIKTQVIAATSKRHLDSTSPASSATIKKTKK